MFTIAAAQFRRRGYATSTTRELADALGIKKASLYHHIDGKEDLLFAICRESLRRITHDVRAVAQSEPEETRLRRMIETHVLSALTDRDMHAVMLTELRALSPERHDRVVQLRDAYEQLLHDAIAADQVAGRLRDDLSTKDLRLGRLNILNWTIFWFEPGGETSAEQLGARLASLFLEGANRRG
jgi:AcrR family transcriptional regulator